MKRLTLLIAFVGALFIESNAQKFALIDMEYILKNIPAYEMANEQLKQVSEKWEKEVSAQAEKVEALYKEYQANSIFYTDDQKKAKEDREKARKARSRSVKAE